MTDNPLAHLNDKEPDYIIATYQSRCGICDEMIFDGDKIKKVDDEWAHYECDG